MTRERVTDTEEREATPGTWRARRKVLLVLATLVPMVLMVFSVNAPVSAMAPPGHGLLLAVTALLITGVGGYVIWGSLTALARGEATARARRVLSHLAHHTS
jgi:hypothetical protein